MGYTLAHWVHLIAATVVLGSAIYVWLVVLPAQSQLTGEAAEAFARSLRRRSTALSHGGLLLLAITGLINFTRRYSEGVPAFYQMIFGIKFLLFTLIFGITIALTIPSDALKMFQDRRKHWIAINVLLGIIVLLLSAWLRMIPPKVG